MSLETSDVVAFCTTSFKARYLVSLPGASLETRSAFTAFRPLFYCLPLPSMSSSSSICIIIANGSYGQKISTSSLYT